MELILVIAAVVVFVMLRRQHTRLAALERDVASLSRRLSTASTVADAPVATPEAAPDPVPVLPDVPEPEPPLEEGENETAGLGPWQRAAAAMASQEQDATPAGTAAKKTDLETALGARWAVWVGGLALALGGVFLVRYSIEAGIFGPGVRLTAAALFGIALAVAGEAVRRKGFRAPVGGIDAAYVPAILTAAAAFTLFAATYAAHGVYGFIGPAITFVLLGALALATVAAALIHGKALAGLGLLGSYLTPVLVSSDAPSPWTLFVYLAIVLTATVTVAAFRRWRFLATAAYAGAGLWTIVYLLASREVSVPPVALLHIVGLAVLGGVWLRNDEGKAEAARIDPVALTAGLSAFFAAAMLVPGPGLVSHSGQPGAALLLVAMLAVAAWRGAATPLLHAAGLATVLIEARGILAGRYHLDFYGGGFAIDGQWLQDTAGAFTHWAAALAALFLAGGIAMAWRSVSANPGRAAAWALWAAAVPVCVTATTWLSRGNLDIDWRFAATGLALAGILAAAGELVGRAEQQPLRGGGAVSCLLAGSAAALAFALLVGFGPVLTTVLTGLAAALPAAATRLRTYPALGWLCAGFAAVTLARIGIEPTIAVPELLSVTPVFNALTPGYLLPSAAFAYAAWQLARTTGGRPRLAMEAFAALFALLGAAMLVRHAMNGGVIDASEPTLAEQAIYTLIMIGGGAVLLALDRRAPSPVFRFGSMALGVVSTVAIAMSHFVALNPLFTNESTGAIPVFNLLLLAYLLPAAAMGALAWRARGIRPEWYVTMLSAGAAALAFAYVTLSVRRLFQGEFIGAWKGMDGVETWAHSAAWLALGVAILVAGMRFGSRSLRLASGVLVVAAVAKVFLYDMRELEGVLRALSFIGLGGVLIGIGMFYQRMLAAGRD